MHKHVKNRTKLECSFFKEKGIMDESWDWNILS